MRVNLGGIVSQSTIDWPGRISQVIFFRGCPFRCPFCHNRELQSGFTPVELSELVERIFPRRASGQSILHEFTGSVSVDAIVLSGGEPLAQPDAAEAIARESKARGLAVGVETNGYYPESLRSMISDALLDKVFLDIKAAPREEKYFKATGVSGALPRVLKSLNAIVDLDIPFEIRITVFPGMPDDDEIVEIYELLRDLTPGSLDAVVLQQGLPVHNEFEPVSPEHLEDLARSLNFKVRVKSTSRSVNP